MCLVQYLFYAHGGVVVPIESCGSRRLEGTIAPKTVRQLKIQMCLMVVGEIVIDPVVKFLHEWHFNTDEFPAFGGVGVVVPSPHGG